MNNKKWMPNVRVKYVEMASSVYLVQFKQSGGTAFL